MQRVGKLDGEEKGGAGDGMLRKRAGAIGERHPFRGRREATKAGDSAEREMPRGGRVPLGTNEKLKKRRGK